MASAKTKRIVYWVATGLLCTLMTGSAINYFLNFEAVAEEFAALGYPTHLIIPLAIAKLLGVVAILSNKSQVLKEWAYAGFFFDFVLAFLAHFNANDSEWAGAVVATVFLFVSHYFSRHR
ncbi:MAG: DoxX family protein [Bacteroidota bacterium]